MKLTQLIDEDFTNFKKAAMFLGTTRCSGKCYTECGLPKETCQNCDLMNGEQMEVPDDEIVDRYLSNPITRAIVIGGLEPFDTWDEVYEFVMAFRQKSNDPIVIYTGYYPNEVVLRVNILSSNYENIYIKYGRYIPGRHPVKDPVLGIELASPNQFGVKVS